MKLRDLYENLVSIGIKYDPRSKKKVKDVLLRNRKNYNSLKKGKKAAFDKESLFNPYDDTRILFGEPDREIKTMMVGIDIDVQELLLADRLNQRGQCIDLVISHHPGGRAFSELYKVMSIQTDMLMDVGMSEEIAKDLMGERIAKVERGLHARNCMRHISAAKALDIALICCHTASDNAVSTYLQRMFDKKKPKSVGAVADLLESIPEYKEGSLRGIGPKIINGDRKKPAGRVYVDMTGGTEGSNRIFARLSQIGIGTVVGMHFSEEHYKEAKKEHMNVVIAGHIPSDSVGLNIVFDELTARNDIDIIECSGFMRYSRR